MRRNERLWVLAVVLATGIFLFSIWMLDVAVGAELGQTMNLTVGDVTMEFHGELTNGFYTFSAIQIYHICLYIAIASWIILVRLAIWRPC